MLSDYYNDKVSVKRKEQDGYKKVFQTVETKVPAFIQKITPSRELGDRGRFTSDYHMFTDREMHIHDRIIDQNDKEYDVTGVTPVAFGNFNHYEVEMTSV